MAICLDCRQLTRASISDFQYARADPAAAAAVDQQPATAHLMTWAAMSDFPSPLHDAILPCIEIS
jgi:hypothetical protein